MHFLHLIVVCCYCQTSLPTPLQVIHVSYLIWHQCAVDIFFMDWERPRGLLLSSNLSAVPRGTTPTSGTKPTSVATPISIWRTYFVANEWNEIQSVRKINHTILLVLVLLFQEVCTIGCCCFFVCFLLFYT